MKMAKLVNNEIQRETSMKINGETVICNGGVKSSIKRRLKII